LSDTKSLRAFNTSPPRNCFSLLRSKIECSSGTALGLIILLVVRRGAQAMYNQFDKRGWAGECGGLHADRKLTATPWGCGVGANLISHEVFFKLFRRRQLPQKSVKLSFTITSIQRVGLVQTKRLGLGP